LARPNYSHSKRQRELVKKQKREEKLARKLEKKNSGPEVEGDGTAEPVDGAEPTDTPAPEA
jgi:hypothetical protein